VEVLLLEDEGPALALLAEGVRAWDPAVRIAGGLGSVAEAVAFLRSHRAPDLILMDVQLSDGLSLDVLRQVELSCPVVVVTAHDSYVLEALALNCIDYLLKPVRQERLAQALDKYLRLRQHFAGDLAGLLRSLGPRSGHPDRVLVRKGLDFLPLPVAEIAYFFAEYKLVFVRDRAAVQYLVDRALAELESELDPRRFFRLNRKYLAHVDAVKRFRPGDKGRLVVTLQPEPAEAVIVSQERAAAFRAWLGRESG
jgi:two-component system LytT family response regulator